MSLVDFKRHADDMESNLHFKFGFKADEQEKINDYRTRHSIKSKSRNRNRNLNWNKAFFPNIIKCHRPLYIECSNIGTEKPVDKDEMVDIFWRTMMREPIPIFNERSIFRFKKIHQTHAAIKKSKNKHNHIIKICQDQQQKQILNEFGGCHCISVIMK